MSITVNNYYKQISFIGAVKDDQISDYFNATETTMIGNECGTYQLIDSMIRDLVSIKNKIKDRREELLKATPTANANGSNPDTMVIGDESTIAATTAPDTVQQADIYYNSVLDVRGVSSQLYVQPTMYKNDNGSPAKLSEMATFEIIRRAAYIIKTLRRASKIDITSALTTINSFALIPLNIDWQ